MMITPFIKVVDGTADTYVFGYKHSGYMRPFVVGQADGREDSVRQARVAAAMAEAHEGLGLEEVPA